MMGANARTERTEGGVRSKDNCINILGAYGRDALSDNGILLMSLVTNHDVALVNTFSSTPKGGVCHILSTGEAKATC